MASLRSKVCMLLLVLVLLAAAEVKAKLFGDNSACESDNSALSLRSSQPSWAAGPEPGDRAEAFTVRTLDGEFSYKPGTLRGPLIIHAFTNKSGFLECMWSSESSLTSLVQDLPDSTQVLFLSLDDSAVSDALWMRDQVHRVAVQHSKTEILSRLHFCPVPIFDLGNWIPSVFYHWSSGSRISQAVFTSEGWKLPLTIKRLDARYKLLKKRWEQSSYQLVDAGDGCDPSPSVTGAVAWVSEGNCSFFTKMQNMAKHNASGVLVYALPGNPIQDLNCDEDDCNRTVSIPASMVHLEDSVVRGLQSGQPVYVTFQSTPFPRLIFSIDHQGLLAEMGLFLYPSFSFVNWQAQWFDFHADLLTKLQNAAKVVPVFDKVRMQGARGAVATVDMPSGLSDFTVLELDASLSCPEKRDLSCAHWDHTVQLFVCCDHLGPYCNMELGRWISAYRRGIGHWLTDVSPLLPLLDGNRCTLTMKTVPWAMPWIVSLNLRFSVGNQTGIITGNDEQLLRPFRVMSLYGGGTFNKRYNKRYQPINFTVPASVKKVELYAVITGHGSDNNHCGEFCVTSHHFLFNSVFNNTLKFESAETVINHRITKYSSILSKISCFVQINRPKPKRDSNTCDKGGLDTETCTDCSFLKCGDSSGSALGCTTLVKEGAIPNEYGTWLYGRAGWCCGLQVNPWRVDITKQLNMRKPELNTVIYFGLYEGRDPNPTKEPGYVIMSSFLVFYK
ncbi:hypothetical protein D9C73_016666 [Collichthys lucidus]|uniref:Peptide-N-glycosidase F N-terminal domain-containing protein n=1 Tax=Collichthys lucidus TaxID=240159 RepID=A0A4U5V419_COLLU|nr:hypothetical protein D9C73_016666 [Collichthys lucidus]